MRKFIDIMNEALKPKHAGTRYFWFKLNDYHYRLMPQRGQAWDTRFSSNEIANIEFDSNEAEAGGCCPWFVDIMKDGEWHTGTNTGDEMHAMRWAERYYNLPECEVTTDYNQRFMDPPIKEALNPKVATSQYFWARATVLEALTSKEEIWALHQYRSMGMRNGEMQVPDGFRAIVKRHEGIIDWQAFAGDDTQLGSGIVDTIDEGKRKIEKLLGFPVLRDGDRNESLMPIHEALNPQHMLPLLNWRKSFVDDDTWFLETAVDIDEHSFGLSGIETVAYINHQDARFIWTAPGFHFKPNSNDKGVEYSLEDAKREVEKVLGVPFSRDVIEEALNPKHADAIVRWHKLETIAGDGFYVLARNMQVENGHVVHGEPLGYARILVHHCGYKWWMHPDVHDVHQQEGYADTLEQCMREVEKQAGVGKCLIAEALNPKHALPQLVWAPSIRWEDTWYLLPQGTDGMADHAHNPVATIEKESGGDVDSRIWEWSTNEGHYGQHEYLARCMRMAEKALGLPMCNEEKYRGF